MKRFSWAVLSVAVAATSAGAAGTQETPRYKMRWIIAHQPAAVYRKAAERFAERLKKETHGAFSVEVITPAEAGLGKGPIEPEKVIAKVGAGEFEMGQAEHSALAGLYDKKLYVLGLPYLFRDDAHVERVLEGSVGRQLLADMTRDVRGLAFTYSGGFRVIAGREKAVRTKEDFAGQTMHVGGGPVGAYAFGLLGAKAHEGVSNIESLLAGGKADLAETTLPRFWDQRMYKSAKVVTDTRHNVYLTVMIINEKFFQGLPADLQQALQRAAVDIAREERRDSVEEARVVAKQLAGAGVKYVELKPEERARLSAAMRPAYEHFAPEFGEKLIHEIEAAGQTTPAR